MKAITMLLPQGTAIDLRRHQDTVIDLHRLQDTAIDLHRLQGTAIDLHRHLQDTVIDPHHLQNLACTEGLDPQSLICTEAQDLVITEVGSHITLEDLVDPQGTSLASWKKFPKLII